jgi:hypothetical protein
MLILQEPICGSTSYTCLQMVPQELHNILFIAFHTNAIGGHLNTYRTLHRLQLHFYWPGMLQEANVSGMPRLRTLQSQLQ